MVADRRGGERRIANGTKWQQQNRTDVRVSSGVIYLTKASYDTLALAVKFQAINALSRAKKSACAASSVL